MLRATLRNNITVCPKKNIISLYRKENYILERKVEALLELVEELTRDSLPSTYIERKLDWINNISAWK